MRAKGAPRPRLRYLPSIASDPHQAFARTVLDAEAAALHAVPLDGAFDEAVALLVGLTGTLLVGGIGKSGHIAAKLSATFASTGTPSHVLNPVEAVHGDLGRVRGGDVALLLTRSGTTDEVVELAQLLRRRSSAVPVLAMVAVRPDAPPPTHVSHHATLTLPVGDTAEACPHALAPTASTTAMLGLGDALALSVSRQRAFSADDFHANHPGGGLGRLLMPVVEVMRFRAGANLALIPQHLDLAAAHALAREAAGPDLRRAGALIAVDNAGRLTGVFTDGDLRRLAFAGDAPGHSLQRTLADVMTRTPQTLPAEATVRDAVALMRDRRLDELPVVDADGRPIGLIDVQDLVGLRVW